MLTSERLLLLPLSEFELAMALDDPASFQFHMNVAREISPLAPHVRHQAQRRLIKMQQDPQNWLYYAPWIILHQNSRHIVGLIGFSAPPKTDGSLELLYLTFFPYHNCGFMTEALAALTDFSFQTLGASKLTATTLRHNAASHHILERQGFKAILTDEINITWQLDATRQEC